MFENKYNEYKNIAENRMEELLNIKGSSADVIKAMKYSVDAGGKRIRPVLTLSICEALGGNIQEATDYACAIEFIHTYSLIHDDLPAMDNDDLRRGKPTNHKVFGEGMAVLAGDGLLNFAYEVMLNSAKKHGCKRKFVEAASIIAEASGIFGMVGGQSIDIGSGIEDGDILLEMYSKKTGALINAACMSGCVIAEREDLAEIIGDFSRNLGLAFQIKDDILDIVGNVEKLGKTIGSDANNSKGTYVALFGLEESKTAAEKYSLKAFEIAESLDKKGFLSELTHNLLIREK